MSTWTTISRRATPPRPVAAEAAAPGGGLQIRVGELLPGLPPLDEPDELEVEPLLPHPQVDVQQREGGRLDDAGDRSHDRRDDGRHDVDAQLRDEDLGRRVGGTRRRGRDDAADEAAGDAERDADHLRDRPHDQGDERDDAERAPEVAVREPPRPHHGRTQRHPLQHDRARDHGELGVDPHGQRDERETADDAHEHRADRSGRRPEQREGEDDARQERDHDEPRQGEEQGPADQGAEPAADQLPQPAEGQLLAQRLARHIRDDDALQQRAEDGGDDERQHAEDDAPADQAGAQGRLVLDIAGEHAAREQGDAAADQHGDQDRGDALQQQRGADGDARIAPERLEGGGEQRAQRQRAQRDEAGLRRRRPAGLLAGRLLPACLLAVRRLLPAVGLLTVGLLPVRRLRLLAAVPGLAVRRLRRLLAALRRRRPLRAGCLPVLFVGHAVPFRPPCVGPMLAHRPRRRCPIHRARGGFIQAGSSLLHYAGHVVLRWRPLERGSGNVRHD
ncbi:hypothetical protein [Leifsonia xyli]|uniref:hypothetical protein n=1 Tax=Leifsonia xyli TaxID=1575 RepID=UPI003D66A729